MRLLLQDMNMFRIKFSNIVFFLFCVLTCFIIVHIYSEKQLKDIKIVLTLITFWNIIFKKNIFVIDRIITMQLTKVQIEIHGSLVMIQYYTKCTDPLYPKFTSKNFSALNFCCNLYQVITYVLILTTDKS